jgi:hypothetical protein
VKAKKKKGSKKICIDNNDKANAIHLIHFKTLGIYEQQQKKHVEKFNRKSENEEVKMADLRVGVRIAKTRTQ